MGFERSISESFEPKNTVNPLYAWFYIASDSANHVSKISGKKIPKVPKRQNLNLPCARHYAESMQMKWEVAYPV